jgi:hypothetical protein
VSRDRAGTCAIRSVNATHAQLGSTHRHRFLCQVSSVHRPAMADPSGWW